MERIEDLLDRQFWTVSKKPCWTFSQKILALMYRDIPAMLGDMSQIEEPKVGAVVLFRQKKGYHCGVVWPDCLHFIHVRTPLSQPDRPPVARKDRLSDPLYEPLIDGFYV